MFRVSTVDERSHMLITIDGQLAGEYVEFLEHCCDQASAGGKPVHLLVRDVSLIDQSGRQLLRRLLERGVHLRANGVYNNYLVRECSNGGSGQTNTDEE